MGKIIGGGVGFILGKWPGLALGLILGNALDRAAKKGEKVTYDGFGRQGIETAFSRCTFQVMGKLAKADGPINQTEIDCARQIMSRLRLTEDQKLEAMSLFNQGKAEDFEIEPCLKELRDSIGRRVTLAQFFIELQLQIAYADGDLKADEKRILQAACRILGINRIQFEIINQRVSAQSRFSKYQKQSASGALQLEQAYKILGVSPKVTDAEVKKAYRRLMSQHHPDKLASKGLPSEMHQIAKEKSQSIQQAYDLIRKSRKSRT